MCAHWDPPLHLPCDVRTKSKKLVPSRQANEAGVSQIRKLLSSLLAVACIAAARAQDAGSPQLSDSPDLQWSRVETADAAILRSAPSSSAERAIQAAGLTPRVGLIQPILQDQQDLSVYLTGERLGAVFDMARILDRMQVVPGLPDDPRYKDPRYDRVRDAFTPECLKSTQNYRSTASRLLAMSMRSASIASALPITDIASYDRDCLTPLDRIPQPIKQVVGVLVIQSTPFCSATIVGRRTIVTSKHCFIDADDGRLLESASALFARQVSFVPLVPHGGRTSFTVAEPATSLPSVAFAPGADYLTLEVKYWDLEHAATLGAEALDNSKLPLAAWIVGSNATLSDVIAAKEPLALTRGSGPQACSVLQVTANHCIYHSCQTGPKTSGAGVLVLDATNSVRLVGVHKGPMSRARGCEDQPPLEHRLNFAAALSSQQLQGILKP